MQPKRTLLVPLTARPTAINAVLAIENQIKAGGVHHSQLRTDREPQRRRQEYQHRTRKPVQRSLRCRRIQHVPIPGLRLPTGQRLRARPPPNFCAGMSRSLGGALRCTMLWSAMGVRMISWSAIYLCVNAAVRGGGPHWAAAQGLVFVVFRLCEELTRSFGGNLVSFLFLLSLMDSVACA